MQSLKIQGKFYEKREIDSLADAFVAFFAQAALAQKADKPINLLFGEIQANGLPKGWETAVDNFDCTIKFDENKAI